jgi:signal peptidase I
MELIGSSLEFIKTVAIIVLVAFGIRFYLVQPFVVDGSSMVPTFEDGEYLLVDKISYHTHSPKRGDVVVFHPPSAPALNYIKRVIATPGDQIEIKNGEIFINGARLTENYLPTERTLIRNTAAANLSRKMGVDEYFVLGDNREHSSDSREWGTVPATNIIGRAWIVVFPTSRFGLVFQPSYLSLAGLTLAAR